MVLDRIDCGILAALQNDGRLSNKELAARVGLAPSSCLARVRRLREGGVLRGVHADVDPRALGGRALEDSCDFEPLWDVVYGEPNALEVAAQTLLELAVLLRGEVVRELVVVLLSKLVDHASDRAVLKLLVRDVAEVALLDERLSLVADSWLGDAVAGQLEVESDCRKRRGCADEES